MSELLKWIAQAFVVVIGWYVVHKLSAARDRDKARREMVAKTADSLIADLTDLLVAARGYHSSERDVATELRLKIDLNDLSERAQSLTQVCNEAAALASCRSDIAAVRRAISGKHFEDEHLGPLQESAEQYQAIADAVLKAKRSFTIVKHKQYLAE